MVSAFLKDFPLGHEATTEGAQLLRSVRNYVAQSVGREEGGLYTVARSPRSHQSHAATPVSFHSVELNEERIPFSMPQSGTEHLLNDLESTVELAAHEESHGAEAGVDVDHEYNVRGTSSLSSPSTFLVASDPSASKALYETFEDETSRDAESILRFPQGHVATLYSTRGREELIAVGWAWKEGFSNRWNSVGPYNYVKVCAGVLVCDTCHSLQRPHTRSKKQKVCGPCGERPFSQSGPCSATITFRTDFDGTKVLVTHQGLHQHQRPPVQLSTATEKRERIKRLEAGERDTPSALALCAPQDSAMRSFAANHKRLQRARHAAGVSDSDVNAVEKMIEYASSKEGSTWVRSMESAPLNSGPMIVLVSPEQRGFVDTWQKLAVAVDTTYNVVLPHSTFNDDNDRLNMGSLQDLASVLAASTPVTPPTTPRLGRTMTGEGTQGRCLDPR